MSLREKIDSVLSTPTRRRLASGAVWGSVAAAGSRILTVAASFFLARILGQVGFGEYGMINSTAGMVSGLAGLGIGLTVTKHVAQFKNTDPDRAGRIIALSSMVTMVSAVIYGIAFVVLAPWLATATIAAPHLAPLLQISAITVAMGVVNGVQTCSLDGCEAFRAKSYISVGTGIAQTVMVVLGAWLWGLKGAVIAMALGMVLTVIVTRWVVTKEWRRFKIKPQWREAKEEWRVLTGFSLPMFLMLVTVGPTYWACAAFLANQSNGYGQLGIFNAGTQWQGVIQFLPSLVCTALIPVMSEKFGMGDVKGAFAIMRRMMGLIAGVVLPLAILLSLFSPLIMKGYGSSFADGYWTLVILLFTGAISAFEMPLRQFAIAIEQVWLGFSLNLIWMTIILSGSWFLVKYGAEGLAGARLVATVVHLGLFYWFVSRKLSLKLKQRVSDVPLE